MQFQRISPALSALSALLLSQVQAIDISYQSHIKPSQASIDALRHRGNNSPKITQANNGIPIVNIADANKAGISNNYFTDFNVGQEGLIFNNSKELFINTTLAGYINGNSNLTNEASLILGQVTGSNPSSLLGVMEIAGKKADLIIANPNGITCNGCGVLNAKSFTLSTGSISQTEIDKVANSNELQKTLTMMTERGHINIEALNASNVSKLNIIAKSASVNGTLLAQDLQMILGANKISFDLNNKSDASLLLYEPIKIKNAQGEEETRLALDVSYLGSVVAHSIYLVATEEGVGVKNSGSMATTRSKEEGDGGFVIDVNGVVTISTPQNNKSTLDKNSTSPSLISSSDLTIRAKELHNGSIISANNDISITADKVENKSRYEIKDVVVNYDETSWKVNMNINKIVVKTWTVEERIYNFSPAIIQSGGNLTIKATNITNDMGHLTAGSHAVFETKEKFENKAPELKTKIYKQEYKQYGITGKKEMRFEGLENQWYSKNNLPHYNTKDLILSTQNSILTQALEKIGELNYTQESRKEYTDLSSFLSSSSFQEYLQSNTSHPTLITQELKNAYNQDKLKSQEQQALNSLEQTLKKRLQETQESQENINPNEISSVGVNAESVKIEAGEIINTSLIEAGYTTIIGDSVLNKNGTIVSREDLNIEAKDFKNLGADLIAGNDLTIKADKVEIGTRETYTDYLKGLQHTISNIKGGNNITISSNTDAKFTSVNLEANNTLSISAKENVIFDTAQNISVTQTSSTKTKVKWFKTTKTTTTTTTTTTTNIANSLKGNNISITAGNDLTGYNIKAEAKENLALSAGNDLILSTKADEKKVEEHKVEKSFGFQGHKENNPIRKNVGVSLGYTETTTDINTNIKTHNNQTLSANNITLSSNNQTTLESINTDSKNISILGKDVTITALSDSYDQTINKKEEFWGVGVSIGVNTYVPSVEVGAGFANTETTSTDTLYQTTTSSTNINANNITITTANKNNKPQGNINIIGSNLNGNEINLAGKDVSIKAHKTEYKQTHTSTTKTKFQTGMQVGVGVNGVTVGMDLYGVANILDKTLELASVDLYELPPQKLNTSYQESSGNSHTGSSLMGNNIVITSKKDTNIVGSSVNATGDTTITGKNVNVIASIDTKTEYGYEFGYGINSNIGSSNLIGADVRVDGYAEGQAHGSVSTNVNNSSITSGNLTINTKKGFLDPLNGNVNIIGGNLNANNVNMNVKGDLNIGSIQSHSASGKADLEAKTGSILSVIAFQPIDINGNIQGNLNATIKEQSGIKADKVNITTNRNTSLSNAYISATDKNSSIQTNTMTKLDFKDIYLGLNQNVDVRGLLGIDSWIKLGVNFSELKNNITSGQIVPVIEQIADIAKLNVGGKGWIGGITVSHPSTISQNIKVKIGKNKEEPKNIFRGEANEAKKVETLKPLYNSNGKFWVKK